jgi:serine/threonine protein kinase
MNDVPHRDSEIFTAAIQLPVGERAAFLERMCIGDAELRQRVEGLLQTHARLGDFLEQPLVEPNRSGSGVATGALPGDRIGRYKLLQQIGEGGCGVVYMAEQEEPVRRRVALKVIKPGMDTRSVIARFEAERQALAMMDHPGIAKVFDAGATESGRPYFVMELIRGIKITDYCDQNSLTTEERLKLFIQVCQAVQHAHQKGVIHRDIKPSNILVTTTSEGAALPVVIDFGIAKATTNQRLTDKTVFTAFQMLIGTPAYMSPEQATLSNVDVDTRTDIYSLGVLLYELLTGRTPFETEALLKAGLDEIRRVIREDDPIRPSTRLSKMTRADLAAVARNRKLEPPRLIRAISGDLDCIALKALQRDPSCRYETANGMAVDVGRFLANEPIAARPPSRLYKFRKLASRNKLSFAAAGIVILTLIAALSVTTWSLGKEKRARKDAEVAQDDANSQRKKAQAGEHNALIEAARNRQTTDFLKKMLQGVNPAVAVGRDTTILRQVLDQTVERMGKELTNQPAVEADLKLTIGEVYGGIGLYDKEEVLISSALALYRNSAPSSEQKQKIADALGALAGVHVWEKKYEEGEREAREALAIDPTLTDDTMRKIVLDVRLGWILIRKDRSAEAEPMLRKALANGRRLVGDESEQLLDVRAALATALNLLGQLAEAESLLRQSLKIGQQAYSTNHPFVANDLYRLTLVLMKTKSKREEAEACIRKCVAMRRAIYSKDHPLIEEGLVIMAGLLRLQNKDSESAEAFREAVEIRTKRTGDEDASVAFIHSEIAGVLRMAGDELKFADEFPEVWVLRSESWARKGLWSQALSAASRFLEIEPTNHVGYHLAAPLLVVTGDRKKYEELCVRIAQQFATETNPYVADRMAKDCLILPRPSAELKVPLDLAERAVTAGKDERSYHFFLFCNALAEYRLDHWDKAIDRARRAEGDPQPVLHAETSAVLAMALFKSGKASDARSALGDCAKIIEEKLPKPEQDLGFDWRDWIIAHALQSEATGLIIGGAQAGAAPTSVKTESK